MANNRASESVLHAQLDLSRRLIAVGIGREDGAIISGVDVDQTVRLDFVLQVGATEEAFRLKQIWPSASGPKLRGD